MDLRSYRASSLQEALQLVRHELGPDASVLHTREVQRGVLQWLTGKRPVEVTASSSVQVPSRFPREQQEPDAVRDSLSRRESPLPPADRDDYREMLRQHLDHTAEPSMVEQLCALSLGQQPVAFRGAAADYYQRLVEGEVGEALARQLVTRVVTDLGSGHETRPEAVRDQLLQLIADEIVCREPLVATPGKSRILSVVGPTGVGKTTTIAKLASNACLREAGRVGFITVDTYRMGAVDQLRTYAEIIDAPLDVVSSPQEMRDAVARQADLDWIYIDTAGRSPQDEARMSELQTMLAAADADEVMLVLSSVASRVGMQTMAERFASVGPSSLVVTKLDEAVGVGHLLPVVRKTGLPLSYLTHGQDVPHDIAVANSLRLARMVLGLQAAGS